MPSSAANMRARMCEPGSSGSRHIRNTSLAQPPSRISSQTSILRRARRSASRLRSGMKRNGLPQENPCGIVLSLAQHVLRSEGEHLGQLGRFGRRRTLLGKLRHGELREDRTALLAADQDGDRADRLLEDDPRLGAGERDLSQGGEHVGRAHGGMAGEGKLGLGREDPQAAGVLRLVRRQDEDRLREVELPGDPLHEAVGQPAGIREDRQGISLQRPVGEHVGGDESAAHDAALYRFGGQSPPYSWRSASIGLRRAAWRAGRMPKTTPTAAEKTNAITHDLRQRHERHPERLAPRTSRRRGRRRCRACRRGSTARPPRRGTAAAPRSARAPIARRMPISRVRSVTETSMMFMMPMPPTSRLTPAIAPEQRGQRAGGARHGGRDLLHVAHVEVVLAARAVRALAQERFDLALHQDRSAGLRPPRRRWSRCRCCPRCGAGRRPAA